MHAGEQVRTVGKAQRRPASRRRAAVAFTAAAALLAALTPAASASTSPAYRKARPHTQVYSSVAGAVVTTPPAPASRTAATLTAPVTPRWPAGGAGTATVRPRLAEAIPGTGVTGSTTAAAAAEVPVTVSTSDQQLSALLGITGVVFTVTAPTPVDLTLDVDYGPWLGAAGGDWASRLQVLALPGCATSSPQTDGCAKGTPIPVRNDRAAHRLQLAVPAAAAGKPGAAAGPAAAGPAAATAAGRPAGVGTSTTRTFAVTAAPNGGTGSYAATPLSAASSWRVGNQTGNFTWTYPIAVPPGVNGPAPDLSIDYSSGSVDGRVESTNNQTSWVGEGHSLDPGYVERRYVPCSIDMAGGNNATRSTGDLCWRSDNATVVLGGHASELVKDAATGTWKLRDDDGSKIERLNTGSNADNDHEMWALTSQDGTRYVFGGGLRGAADTAPNSNATWTVPVAGNQPGEPCYNTSFAVSFCTQAWRWNLDYVVDVHGNSMSYSYTPETNNYGRNNGTTKVGYTRGGYLNKIEYGQRAGSEQAAAAPARVLFDTAERCIPTATVDCAPATLTASTAPSWPDVPFDLLCADGAATCAGQPTPSFFSRRRLTTISTQTWNGAGYSDVDSWALGQSFPSPGDGTAASLWLASVTHTGKVGGTAAIPSVTFDGLQLQNRVDGGLDGAYPLIKWRVNTVRLETGGVISVAYSAPDCVYGTNMPAGEDSNSKRCFPAYYTPPGATTPVLHYFHKYVVNSLIEDGITAAGVAKTTTYAYLGAPAWHYDDNELAQPKYRTWSDWRGYGQVKVTVGVAGAGAQSAEQDLYLRGMDGDLLKTGAHRSVSVTDSQGGTVVDQDRLRGYLREHQVLDGPAGGELRGALNTPWVGPVTAADAVHAARMLQTAVVDGRRTLAGGAVQHSQVSTTFDAYGLASSTDDAGDIALSTDDLCTRTEYARNPASNLVRLVSRSETVSVRCAATPNRPGDVVADTRGYYDGSATLGAPPTAGDPTRTEQLSAWTTGPVYTQRSRTSYDQAGRVLDSYDALDRKTSTAYTPAAGGPVTATTSTNALGHLSTTTLDAARGATVAQLDANNNKTELAYDPLGRLTGVWLPNRPRATASPSLKFGYLLRKDGPVSVTTDTLINGGGYRRSTALFDGLLRPVQTQTQAPLQPGQTAAGRLLTDTRYDERGLPVTSNGPYYNAAPPGSDLFGVADNAVPTQTKTSYDGAGRPTLARFRSYDTDKWATTTSYGGDRVTVTPPAGGVATTTLTDMRGRTSELRQYKDAGVTANTAGSYDSTRYSYTPADQLAALTDPAGNTWAYSYDLRHRQVASQDPDTGRTALTYDDAGQLRTSTDARGQVLATSYDPLGRRTELHSDSASGPLRASWSYDTLAKGQPSSASRYDTTGTGTGATTNVYTDAVTGYDALNRPTGGTVTIPAAEGALAGSYHTATFHNDDGTVSETDLPTTGDVAAEIVNYGYDELGHLKSVTGRGSYVGDTTYTPFGETAQITTGSTVGMAVFQTFTHDPATHQLTGAQLDRESIHPTDADLHYSYDPAGNLTKIADTPAGGTADTQCFAYDYLRRLSGAWTGTDSCAAAPSQALVGGPAPYWQSYGYDLTGNRTSRIDHTPAGSTAADTTATYRYPAAGQSGPHTVSAIASTGPAGPRSDTFGYDPAGNTTTRAVAGQSAQTLSWDVEGHLGSVADAAGTTSYLYDAAGGRLVRRDPTGTTLYLAGTEIRLDKAAGASAKATRYYLLNGQAVALKQTGLGTTTLFADPHGTAEFAVANNTAAITRRRSGPFGDDRGTTPGAWPSQQGFLGGTKDPTGLTHLGAREYDPSRGRFLSADPITDPNDPQQLNGYAYANNNPTTNSDPTGLRTDQPGVGWGAGYNAAPPPPAPPAPSGGLTPNAADHQNAHAYYPSPSAADHADYHNSTIAQANQDRRANPYHPPAKAADRPHTGIGWGALAFASDVIGITAAKDCFLHGSLSDCSMTVLNVGAALVGVKEAEIAAATALRGAEALRAAEAGSGARFVVGAGGETTMFLRAGTESLEVTEHAALRMTQRGISIDAAESTLGQPSFQYFHQGVWKTGYYDPSSRIFIGTVDGRLTTVINNASPNYIANLQAATP